MNNKISYAVTDIIKNGNILTLELDYGKTKPLNIKVNENYDKEKIQSADITLDDKLSFYTINLHMKDGNIIKGTVLNL